jgi:hypothetical protein
MDKYFGIDLEARSHLRAVNAKHRDLQQAIETIGLADDHRFQMFP